MSDCERFPQIPTWANCSSRSEEMSDREQIAQIAQRKWATVSESLRPLKTNERPWAIGSGRSEEMSEWAIRSKSFGKKNLKSCFLTFLGRIIYNFFIEKISESLISLKLNRSGHSPKMSDVSDLLRSLTKNERPWAIRSHQSSGRSLKMSDPEWIAQVAHQK